MTSELMKTLKLCTFKLLDNYSPIWKASYSATLLVTSKSSLHDFVMFSFSREISTTPGLAPSFVQEPSMNSFHTLV